MVKTVEEGDKKIFEKNDVEKMEWYALCEKCGILDRMPNGAIIEAIVKEHIKKSKHVTYVAYIPETVKRTLLLQNSSV